VNCRHKGHYVISGAAFGLTCLLSAAAPAIAQQHPNTPMEKWRPMEGTYAEPGADFNARCGEYGDVIVELAEKEISGNEWGCDVSKLTDTAPGAIKLNMTCFDYNLAEYIKDPNPDERKFEEIILLRRIDARSMLVRKSLNGKFEGPGWQASYCPDEAQRMYSAARAKERAEAAQQTPKSAVGK
jgi:hypothetical protein